MGLELFSPDDDTSAVVTAARAPEGVDGTALLRHLRDRHGVTLAPGQGDLKGKIFRIGHIGWFDVFDIAVALAAVELSLTELGADIERGVAVQRAFEAYEQPSPPEADADVARAGRARRRRARRARRIDATIQEFPEGTPTAEAAARAVGCRLEQIVKSLVFVCDGAYVLALVPGDRRADEAKVAAAVGAAEVRDRQARRRWSRRPASSRARVAPFPHAGRRGR